MVLETGRWILLVVRKVELGLGPDLDLARRPKSHKQGSAIRRCDVTYCEIHGGDDTEVNWIDAKALGNRVEDGQKYDHR